MDAKDAVGQQKDAVERQKTRSVHPHAPAKIDDMKKAAHRSGRGEVPADRDREKVRTQQK